MLGYALHPVYADHARVLPTTNVSGIGRLPKIAVYYKSKVIPHRRDWCHQNGYV
ncbi:hypothetical protein JG688_00013962 [Phytophthora aleatoria]|uniref:Uncharacterized protein n=1 Tax=Phytophthora aleatoria TaxID=2496075 RepID=A0A8J5IL85_9STRA|nr:hypothetical protein JG688_00013962 [Phytophthora aleatoria]